MFFGLFNVSVPFAPLMKSILLLSLILSPLLALRAAESPQTNTEIWADFDPRKDALETEVIREWKEDGGVFRHVRYLIGKFKGKPARMAAIYGFPRAPKRSYPQ